LSRGSLYQIVDSRNDDERGLADVRCFGNTHTYNISAYDVFERRWLVRNLNERLTPVTIAPELGRIVSILVNRNRDRRQNSPGDRKQMGCEQYVVVAPT